MPEGRYHPQHRRRSPDGRDGRRRSQQKPWRKERPRKEYVRPRNNRQAFTEREKELLDQRRIYKTNAMTFYSARFQCHMLRICLENNWAPRGLKVSKQLMTLKPHLSNIRDTFKETLEEATLCLAEQLADHLFLVATETQALALKSKQEMVRLTQRCTAGELISHERFLSATEANINRHKKWKQHDTERKLNELAGRPARRISTPTFDVYNRNPKERDLHSCQERREWTAKKTERSHRHAETPGRPEARLEAPRTPAAAGAARRNQEGAGPSKEPAPPGRGGGTRGDVGAKPGGGVYSDTLPLGGAARSSGGPPPPPEVNLALQQQQPHPRMKSHSGIQHGAPG